MIVTAVVILSLLVKSLFASNLVKIYPTILKLIVFPLFMLISSHAKPDSEF